MLSDLMHPPLWEYMKHSQQSDYNRNSLITNVLRFPKKTGAVVRDAS
ncbi:MAG: hypothetical protein VYA84_12560 [Planctomycetota bacterium]|nr:hypothetical protein [Planctomycetota bacterium]